MPLLHTLTSAFLSRRAARRFGRVIPNPVLRYAAVAAATTLLPVLVNRATHAWQSRRSGGPTKRAAHA